MNFKQTLIYNRVSKSLDLNTIEYYINHIKYLNKLIKTTNSVELLTGYSWTISEEKQLIKKELLLLNK